MKCSGEIVWELGAVLRNVGNIPVSYIGAYGYKNVLDRRFGCRDKADVGNFLGDLFNASLSKIIRGVEVISWVGNQHCSIAVWLEDSDNGETNIDEKVLEAFSKLTWKW